MWRLGGERAKYRVEPSTSSIFLFIKLLSSTECALLALYKNKERQRDEKSFSCGKKKKEYKKFWTKVGLGRRNETM